MNHDAISLLLVAVLLFVVIFVFVKIALRIRRSSGSLTTTMFASTYEFYDKEKRASIEQMVEQKVKKMEEQEADKPKE